MAEAKSHSEEEALHSALPGLPDDLATLCIARIPSLACIWSVCRAWRRLLLSSPLFRSVRQELRLTTPQWLYVLFKTPIRFEWHAFDPLAQAWHHLPPLPVASDVAFHLSSPSFIGHSYSVQCAASATRLFIVAACRLGEGSAAQEPLPSSQQLGCVPPHVQTRRRLSVEPALPSPLIFNALTNCWSLSSPLRSGPRCWCATGVDQSGTLIVASGCGRLWDLHVSKSAECYDPDTDAWTPIAGLHSSKFSGEAITAVNYQGKLHMVSGRGVFRKAGVLYDPSEARWLDMPRGMRSGWTGSCVVLDGTLLSLDGATGRLRFYHSHFDTWQYLIEHPMLKGLEQVIAGPGSRLCGLIRPSSGSNNCIRVARLNPSLAESVADMDFHVDCNLSFVDILAPFPNVSIVALQLLSGFELGAS
ncbi:hypothetical protein L7F22_046539 [Adiantum nelumboides]|nr:hypothetical protein [Adiantum nelumboides]